MASTTVRKAETPTEEPKEDDKEEEEEEEEEKAKPSSKITLEDLNNDPSLVYSLKPAEAKKLYEQAETEGGLAHSVLATLHGIGNEDHTPASKEEQENAAAAAASGFGQG